MRSGLPIVGVCAWLATSACATGSFDADAGPGAADADEISDPDTGSLADAASDDDDASLPIGGLDAAPTPDAALPPPDAEPCTPTWIELLTNGNLDSGPTGWTIAGGDVVYTSAMMPISAHTGGYAAWLVGYNNADEQLYQAVSVPADATALRLRGYGCYVTTDTGGAHDYLTIRLRNGGGSPLETLASYSNLDVGAVCSWTEFELDAASAHAGETIQLHLRGTSDGLYVTSYFVDSLHLEAYACPSP